MSVLGVLAWVMGVAFVVLLAVLCLDKKRNKMENDDDDWGM